MLESTKKEIDDMEYSQMLRMWRHTPFEDIAKAASGEPLFQGETGEYFRETMFAKKAKLEDGEAVRISKEIGWD